MIAPSVTTHQANRSAVHSNLVGVEHVGESFAIMQTADTAISLNQTKQEHDLGTFRIKVMRARGSRKGDVIKVWQNLDVGQFSQASYLLPPEEDEDEEEKPSYRRAER